MFDHYAQLKEGALRHLDKAAAFARSIKRPTVADQLDLGRRHLADSRYNIAIVGDMKRGKSTLLNTLLGRRNDDLSPIQSKVCTSAVAHYLSRDAHSEGLSEGRVFFDNNKDPLIIPVEALREYITEEENPENIKGVRSVDVYGDFPLLRNVVTLVDTPGRGAVHRNHEILLEQFMPMADAIIFLIAADIPVTASEREFLNQLGKEERERIFFVLTKRDEVKDNDINEVRRYVKKQIQESNLSCGRLYEVSARKVYEAAREGSDEATLARLRKETGVADLEAELERFIIETSSKNSSMMPRLRSLLDYVGTFCEHASAEFEKDLSLMNTDMSLITSEIQEIKTRAKDLRKSCDNRLKKFRTDWNKAVIQFQRKLEGRSGAISDGIFTRIQKGGLIGVAVSAFKVSTLVKTTLNNELRVLLPDLDQKLAEHCQKLSEEIECDWETFGRSKASNDPFLPAASILGLGGTAVALLDGFTKVQATLAALGNIGGQTIIAEGPWGLWPTVQAWFGFGPKLLAKKLVPDTIAIFYGTLTPTVVAIAAYFAASFIARHAIIAVQEKRVTTLVDDAILKMAEMISENLMQRGEEIQNSYREIIDEQIASAEERLDELAKSVSDCDPSLMTRITGQAEECRRLLGERKDLGHSLSLITSFPNGNGYS